MIGIDLVEIKKINKAIKKVGFISKILTKKEIEYVEQFKDNNLHIAGFFACKEAVMKALENCKKIGFTEIEVLHKESGKPYVRLYGEAKKVFEKGKYKDIEVSISQTENFATAICQIS